jgi:hypothetical protein
MTNTFDIPFREGNPPEIGQVPPQLQLSDLGTNEMRLKLKNRNI